MNSSTPFCFSGCKDRNAEFNLPNVFLIFFKIFFWGPISPIFALMSHFSRNNFIVRPVRNFAIKTAGVAGRVWRNIDIRKPETWLSTLVNLLLRLGTLVLIFTLLALLWRIFQNEGFTIEPFSMPKTCEENGYTGEVMARQLLDAYLVVKKEGYSVKDDKINAEGPDDSELNVAVMGFGVSLRSIAFRLRELVGRPNQLVRGELVRSDTSFVLTIRMTGHTPVKLTATASNDIETVLQKLLRQAGEVVLGNTDPYRLALYQLRSNNFDKAREVLQEMLKTRPEEKHWAQFGQGVVAEAAGNNAEASYHFKSAISTKPDFSLGYQRLAQSCEIQNKLEDAAIYYRKAIAFNPADSLSWNSLGYFFDRQNKFVESDAAFQKAIRLTHNNPYWLLNWVECLYRRGEKERAIGLLADCQASRTDSCSRYWVGGCIDRYMGNNEAAAQKFMQALRFEPDNVFLVQNVVINSYNKGDFQATVQNGAKIYSVSTEDGDESRVQAIWNYTAMAYNFLGKPDSAVYWINKSIDVNPYSGYPYSTLAEIYGMQGKANDFYYWLEQAFIKGFRKRNIDPSQEPYKRYANEKQYVDLLRKYP